MILTYIIYSLLLIFLFNLSKINPNVNYGVVILLILSFLKHIICYNNPPPNKYEGWSSSAYIKQFFLYLAIGSLLLKNKYILNYGNYLVFISILFMLYILIFPMTWNTKTSSWTIDYTQPNINIPLILLSIYVLVTTLKFNLKVVDDKNLSWIWIIIQNILLTLAYSTDPLKFGKTGNLLILSLWIPVILYQKKDYFYFRSLGIALPNIWKGLSPSTLNYLI